MGSHQADAFQAFQIQTKMAVTFQQYTSGTAVGALRPFASSIAGDSVSTIAAPNQGLSEYSGHGAPRTAKETRGTNTALAPRIIAY